MNIKENLETDQDWSVPSEVLRATIEQMERTLEAERVLIVLIPENGGEPELALHRGLPAKSKLGSAEISLSIIKTVLASGRASTMIDAGALADADLTESVNVCGLTSIVCAPILDQNAKTIGALYADDRKKVGCFQHQHGEWLTQIGRALGAKVCSPELPESQLQEPPTKTDIWRKLYTQGIQSRRKNCLEHAQKSLKKALVYCKARKISGLHLASTLNALSEVYRAQGKLAAAEDKIDECLSLVKKENLESHVEIIPFLNNLAGLRYAKGESKEAELLYLDILEKLDTGGRGQTSTAILILSNIGTLKSSAGTNATARPYLQRACDLAEKCWGLDDPRTKKCFLKLSRLGLN